MKHENEFLAIRGFRIKAKPYILKYRAVYKMITLDF